MNKEIKEYIENYCADQGWECDDDEDIWETLEGGSEVYSERRSEHRWWVDVFKVVDLGGRLIGYMSADTTGDNSPADVGWDYDLDTLTYVEKKEETKVVVTYVPTDIKTDA